MIDKTPQYPQGDKAAEIKKGMGKVATGVGEAIGEEGWRIAEEGAKGLLAQERPSVSGEVLKRRAKALTYIINDPEYQRLKPLLMGIDTAAYQLLNGKSGLKNVLQLIDSAKQQGLPVEAVREILPPEVAAIGWNESVS